MVKSCRGEWDAAIRTGDDLAVGVGHGVDAVPGVVVGLPDVGADVGLGEQDGLDGLSEEKTASANKNHLQTLYFNPTALY